MRKKQPKGKSQQAIFRGTGMITTANMHSQLQQFMQGDQFYQVQLAQVVRVLTQEDVNDQNYPVHEYGAIQARLLFTQMEKQLQDMIIMLPRDPYDVIIPVDGQIILCSKHPSFEVDVSEGMVFDQYYYFGILNILNLQNNNSIQDVSYISKDEIAAEPDDQRLGQSNFFINQSIQRQRYEPGDVIKSGRYGHALKFTNVRGDDQKDMLPMTTLTNHQKVQGEQMDYKSKIILLYAKKQDSNLIQVSSKRTLLDSVNKFSLIGDNILLDSERIIINAHKNDVQIYGSKSIEISANENIFLETENTQMESKTINLSGEKSVTILVGDNKIVVNSSGVTITATNINLNGATTIRGITAGGTAGFCSMPVCAFTGAPHTINVVGS